MILYLSLILIVTGIFLIVYSLLSSKAVSETHRYRYIPLFKRKPKYRDSKRQEKPKAVKPDFEHSFGDYRDSSIVESEVKVFDDENSLFHAGQEDVEEMGVSERVPVSEVDSLERIIEDREVHGAEESRVVDKGVLLEEREEDYEELDLDYELRPESFQATLYEDSSNIIDYERSENRIDPTLKEYRNIKRMGKGDIELAKDGINFYIGKKFFRFDYYRIRDLKIGERFIALFLKGSDVVRVFVFERDSGIQSDVKRSYQDYLRRTG